MNQEALIAILDSGVGGLPYLDSIRQTLVGGRYVYVADTLNFPYGTKSPKQVESAVLDMWQRLSARFSPRVVVLACNTASVLALESLRARTGVPVVGVVPAVKPAATLSQKQAIAVMATLQTVEGRYLDDLVRSHAPACRILKYAASGLIQAIEEDPLQEAPQRIQTLLEQAKADFLQAGIDTLVLGCTHFMHVDQELARVMAPQIQVVDSRDGVSRQVARVLKDYGKTGLSGSGGPLSDSGGNTDAETSDGCLFLTAVSPREDSYRRLAARFHLEFGGLL